MRRGRGRFAAKAELDHREWSEMMMHGGFPFPPEKIMAIAADPILGAVDTNDRAEMIAEILEEGKLRKQEGVQ
jgi:hypothetical protein